MGRDDGASGERPVRRRLTLAVAGVATLVALAGVAAVVLSRSAAGTLELAPLVSDGMVLQRDTMVAITGRARPGWPVVVAGSWGAVGFGRADESGAWRADLRTGAGGGPHRLYVWAGDGAVVGDVWIGETWLCAGQSNMAITVADASATELTTISPSPPVRLFTVPLALAETPRRSCGGRWLASTPETTGGFSAVCLAFGRTLQDVLGVPIGLVAAAVPGTEIEAWASERGLREVPEIAAAIDTGRAELDAGAVPVVSRTEQPWRTLDEFTAFLPDDNPLGDSVLSLRADVPMTGALAAGPVVLELPGPLAEATVLVNDHELEPGADGRVLPADVLTSSALTVLVEHRLTAPLAPADVAGAQLRAGEQVVALPPWEARIERPRFGRRFRQRHSLLFNAMIAPLVPYTIRGVVWYQGEANVTRAAQYARTFPALIRDWRASWGLDFAFGFVQLPAFDGYRPVGAITELRDAQRRTLAVPGTGMVVSIDLGDPKNIHSAHKPTIGYRLAAWALARVYERAGFVPSGPMFREMRVEPWAVRVVFDDVVGGLTASERHVKGFELAGRDGQYHPASAFIDRDTIVLRAAAVREPVAVRYAWADVPNPLASLWNGAGLPASPFRSDDWDGVTTRARWRVRAPKKPPAPAAPEQPPAASAMQPREAPAEKPAPAAAAEQPPPAP
jgi:sialate O-acetylesterase